jgi:hypothetical protein
MVETAAAVKLIGAGLVVIGVGLGMQWMQLHVSQRRRTKFKQQC